MSPLLVDVRDGAEPVHVMLAGEIDMASEGQVTAALADLGGHDVIVDLSAVSFIDSSGLRSLLLGHQNITAAGGNLVLRGPSAMTARVLTLGAIDTVLEIIE